MAENMIIKLVLNNPLSVCPFHDKLRTVNRSRPTPRLSNLIICHKTQTERYTRHICISQREKFDWPIGCKTAKKLYFWPSSLFANKHQGLLGFKSFAKCAAKTLKITNSCAQLTTRKLFVKQQRIDLLLDVERRNDVTWHKEQVKKTYECYDGLLILCFL